jgi:hypothetical protein
MHYTPPNRAKLLKERIGLYKKLEKLRTDRNNKLRRALLVYVTSCRANLPSLISADVIPEFMDQLEALPKDIDGIDLLVVSNGGDPSVAWRIMSLLRERVKKVAVFIPQAAYSAATLMALGADEIVMHPNGNLGPVDLQYTLLDPQTSKRRDVISTELVGELIRYAKGHGLDKPSELIQVFDHLCKEVGPIQLGSLARAARVVRLLGKKLLCLHMPSDKDPEAEAIVARLIEEYFDHGYPVGRREVEAILKEAQMIKRDAEVEKLIWAIWMNIQRELREREPYDPRLDMAKELQAENKLGTSFPTITCDYDVTFALLESTCLQSRHVAKTKIQITSKGFDFEIQQAVTGRGWVSEPPPA